MTDRPYRTCADAASAARRGARSPLAYAPIPGAATRAPNSSGGIDRDPQPNVCQAPQDTCR